LKPIPGFTDYFIDTSGNGFSTKSGVIRSLKTANMSSGYVFLSLRRDGKYHLKSVHRLVCETYLNNWDEPLDVNHINGIKTDNRLENLEMCTRSENMRHALKTGLSSALGETHYASKITDKEVLEIRYLLHSKLYTQTYIANMYHVQQQCISKINNKITRGNI